MRTVARDFPDVIGAISDDAVRALFSQRFLVATEIYDELVDAACLRIFEEIEEEFSAKTEFPSRAQPAFHYIVEKLIASEYLLRRVNDAGAAGIAPAPPDAAAPLHLLRKYGLAKTPRFPPRIGSEASLASVESLAAELAETEPDAAVGAEIVTLLAAEAPEFFRGTKTGEEILFSPARLPLWIRYFSNANILYAINNTLGAEALARVLPPHGAEVLEVGGGCGSAAEAALRRLGSNVSRWRFTELVPTFLRRGERAARAAAAPGTLVQAAKLDMTKPWEEQGVTPGSFDAVYSVNCFHVAPDLGRVLAEAKAALKPGGLAVVSECVKPGAHPPPSYVDFVFNFLTSFTDVSLDPVLRPNHGFLSPAAWRASFTAAGFREVTLIPDVDAVAARYPKFFVGAIAARL
ncbi:MAG TPA: class I SAM-dependent methyltransferase [Thermoanaerobaculia bacterium]|nr:class I SAM-dependent methyltransferase [Thermoanaerobaculia bacterium]